MAEILKPNEVDPKLLKRLEKRYGSIDMENDFFSSDLGRYFKTSDTDPNTGKVTHDIINLASFGDSLKELSQALQAIIALSKTTEGKSDAIIQDVAQQVRDVFNQYRTHIRTNYPDQYSSIKDLIEEVSMSGGGTAGPSFTPGTGEQYATPKAFNSNKNAKGAQNIYYYKLGFKPVNREKLRKQAKGVDYIDLYKK